MPRREATIPADYFEALYTDGADPWAFRTSAYEAAKYGATLAALSRDHYGDALEVGCSIGVFTARLAPRCDRLLAIDASAAAIAEARVACQGFGGVHFTQAMVPISFPSGLFDLIVLSEVMYYLTREDLAATVSRCVAAQPDGGEILLCHWLGETDYPLTGEEAGALVVETAVAQGYRHTSLPGQGYRLDRLVRG